MAACCKQLQLLHGGFSTAGPAITFELPFEFATQEVIKSGAANVEIIPAAAAKMRARWPDDLALPVTLVRLLLSAPPDSNGSDGEDGSGAASAAEAAALGVLHDEELLRNLALVSNILTFMILYHQRHDPPGVNVICIVF